ncbi:MAG: TolC family protein [Phycisphaerales bacterium]
MPNPTSRCGPRRSAVVPAALLLLASCAAARPNPDAESQAARAVNLHGALTFRTDAGPLDVAHPTDILTLSDAIERAVTTSPELQAALARVRIAMADADQARLLPNPVLDVAVRMGSGSPQIDATVGQELLVLFQMPRRASAADHRLRQTACDAVTVALGVAADSQELYASAQASEATGALLQERLAILDRLTTVARSRLDAGEGTRGDLASLEAQRVELEVEIAQSEQDNLVHRLRLARLIGEPSSNADWRLEPWSPAAAPTLTVSAWVEAALLNRPEVQAASWKLRALGDEQSLTELTQWDGGRGGVDSAKDDAWAVGPSVSTPIPVFDTGSARRARLTAEQYEARHEWTSTRRRVVEDVRTAHQALSGLAAQLRTVRDALLPLQQRRRALAEDAYRAGQVDVTPVLLAEHDLTLAQERAVALEREARAAMIRLEQAVGGSGVAARLRARNTVSSTEAPPSPLPPPPSKGLRP